MPTIPTHAFMGYVVASLGSGYVPAERRHSYGVTVMALSVLPDADALFMKWIPYGNMLGHRGLSHSLVFAGLLALAAVFILRDVRRNFPGGVWGLFGLFWIAFAMHGVLDALTNGGLGVGFFIPFDNSRFFFPIHPIPVSPIGIGTLLHLWWSIECFAAEFLMLWTIGLGVIILARGRFRYRSAVSAILILIGIVSWISRIF
ncbi:MAG: metal-dependent hydrolase [Candidatus Brocadiia bacterium]